MGANMRRRPVDDPRRLEPDWEEMVLKILKEAEGTETRSEPLVDQVEDAEVSPAETALRQFREEYSRRVRASHAN
jgi:hypothetical protein